MKRSNAEVTAVLAVAVKAPNNARMDSKVFLMIPRSEERRDSMEAFTDVILWDCRSDGSFDWYYPKSVLSLGRDIEYIESCCSTCD